MRAITSRSYGPPQVVRIEDVPAPEPRATQLLVRNHATVVSGAECTARGGKDPVARLYFGLARPRFAVLGTSFAGVVIAVGSAVTTFRVGDEVMGSVGPTLGAHAEYICVGEEGVVVPKPVGLSWADAVAVFDGGLTALPFLRDTSRLTSGQSILINGASGAVGSAAVQLAKHFGAVVTAVCSSANVALVTSLGADRVIDYTAEDFTQGEPATYDVIFDAVGKSSYARCRRLLARGGVYVTTVPSPGILAQMLWTSRLGKTRAAIAFTGLRKPPAMAADVAFLGELARSGRYLPVIDATYCLENAPDAHARVETGRKRGSVVVLLGEVQDAVEGMPSAHN